MVSIIGTCTFSKPLATGNHLYDVYVATVAWSNHLKNCPDPNCQKSYTIKISDQLK